MNNVNTKMLAKLICNVLMDGYPQHRELADAEFQRLNDFCSERANNLAMQMEILLEEATPPKWVGESLAAAQNAKEVIDRQLEQVFGKGIEAGETV